MFENKILEKIIEWIIRYQIHQHNYNKTTIIIETLI